jgi:hypothetical protein
MEQHERIALIDRLLVEATQQREVLEHTMYAQQRTGTEGASNAPGTFVHPEPYTLQEEYAWWQQVHEGLLMVHNILEQIEKSQRQRAAHST